jgi:cobalt/nickel transport system permease protein
MLVEQSAYTNRWRHVAPAAKASFAAAVMASAWIAHRPASLAVMAIVLLLATLLVARVPVRIYFSMLLPPLGFVAVSCLMMLATVDGAGWHWQVARWPAVAATALRALVMLAALLGLVLTTPMPDLLGLLRRMGVPELLLDLMMLCYRMLFVLRQAWDEGMTAQSARLGYGRMACAWRSLGLLTGQMAVQVWQRAGAMQTAALARGYDSRLRFLSTVYPRARRQHACALAAGVLVALVVFIGDRW